MKDKPLKVLNLYAGIGGNRKLWKDVEVTAVELDPQIAAIYQDYFPNDTVIVGDAHQYLLDHFKEFEGGFIWSSPPCPSHSRMRKNFHNNINNHKYPDMRLYQEIIFLDNFFDGKYCIENVIPYYNPLIPAQQHNRHLFWCNFKIIETDKRTPPKQIYNIIAQKTKKRRKAISNPIKYNKGSDGLYGFDLNGTNIKNKRLALRNAVDPNTGLMILNCARNIITKQNEKQIDILFNDTTIQST